MKTIVLAICMVFLATVAGATGTMIKDTSKTPVQTFAPDGTLSAIFTVNSTWKDLSGRLFWSLYVPSVSTCKIRLAPTQAKGAYPQMSIASGLTYGLGVNSATPFVNYSGCTDGEYQAQ